MSGEPGPAPTIPYWHMYTDRAGTSRFVRCAMGGLDFKALTSAPQWQHRTVTGAFTVAFVVLPVGWFGDWHESPKPQWVIPLSGAWYVETMDGQRVEFGPGGIHFGEDQNTVAQDGRKGHLSGVIGDAPCVQMIVQYEHAPVVDSPCRMD